MELEKIFSPDKITLSNLKRIDRENEALFELRLFELSDIVTSVVPLISELRESGLGVYEILTYIGGIDLAEKNKTDTPLNPLFSNMISTFKDRSGEKDRALISALLAKEISNMGIDETDFLSSYERDDTFTYVKNVFADEAYDVISADFDDPRVRYSRDFVECARALVANEVAYALLPFEEKGGTRLNTVSELIWRHDLKVNAVTPVFGPDGTLDLKYALVSKSFTVPSLSVTDDRYLEIKVSQRSNTDISELLSVAASLGHTVYRVNTETFRNEGEGEGFYSVVIRDEGLTFTSFLVYLTLFVTEYFPQGIYKNLE